MKPKRIHDWYWFALAMNIIGSYFKVMDFSALDFWTYVVGCIAGIAVLFVAQKTTKSIRMQQVFLLLFLVFHGLVSLSLPIGMVFALTGSYWLAFKIFVIFYLPSIILVWLNLYGMYLLEKERKKATTHPDR